MKITVDEGSGFCSGVVKAIRKAEKVLEREGALYSLGNIVHNEAEIGRLSGSGLKALSYDEFNGLKNATVLIRAHGEPPRTFETARRNNIRLIDATCPVVRRLQEKIREKHAETGPSGGQVLIFGKKDHPEVRALVGQTGGAARVVRYPADLEDVDPEKPLALFSQTTMNQREFEAFRKLLEERIRGRGLDPEESLEVFNTICTQVSCREDHLRKFAGQHDAVLFVSDRKSSNGQALFRVCRETNADSHFITHPEDLDGIPLEGKHSVGISGATSTPGWLLMEVEERLRKKFPDPGRK